MISLSNIHQFTSLKKIAVVGVSRGKKFGRIIYDELRSRNYTVYAVNPNVNEIDGNVCYPNLKAIPDEIEGIVIVTPKSQTAFVVSEAVVRNIRHVWIQQGAETPESIELAKQYNLQIVFKQCLLMYLSNPVFIHRFHRGINKIIGVYPK